MSKIVPLLLLSILVSACGAMPASSPTPEPASIPTSLPSDSCAPASDWSIELNRSGGIAGFDQTLTVNSSGALMIKSERPPAEVERTLAPAEIEQIAGLLIEACPFEPARSQGTCADCFTYGLEIQMDSRFYSVQATDVTLTPELQTLTDILSQYIQTTN